MKYVIEELGRRNREKDVQQEAYFRSRDQVVLELQEEVKRVRAEKHAELQKLRDELKRKDTSEYSRAPTQDEKVQPAPVPKASGIPPNSLADPWQKGDPWGKDRPQQPRHQQHPQAERDEPQSTQRSESGDKQGGLRPGVTGATTDKGSGGSGDGGPPGAQLPSEPEG